MIKISICIIIEYSLINHTLLRFSIDLRETKIYKTYYIMLYRKKYEK